MNAHRPESNGQRLILLRRISHAVCLLLAVMLVNVVFPANSAFAQDQKELGFPEAWLDAGVKYPPYPDRWDMVLPLESVNHTSINVELIYNEAAGVGSNEIIFRYVVARNLFGVSSFFAGDSYTINYQDFNDLHQVLSKWKRFEILPSGDWVWPGDTIKLANGKTINLNIDNYDPFTSRLELIGPEGLIEKSVSVLFMQDDYRRKAARNHDESGFELDRRYILTKITEMCGLSSVLFPLKDGTFILYSEDANVAVRMDGELGTKSKLLGTRLFIQDGDILSKTIYDFYEGNTSEIDKYYQYDHVYDHGGVYDEQLLNIYIYDYLVGRKAEAK